MSLFRLLFWWRIRYYATATFKLLTRRWEVTIFAILIASPAMMPFIEQLHLLGIPILMLIQDREPSVTLLLWLLIVTFSWGWSGLQAQALMGGTEWHNITALPLERRLTQRVDLAILAIADLPIFLPFLAAIITLVWTGAFVHLVDALVVLTLAFQLPILQLTGLQRSLRAVWLLVTEFAGLLAYGIGASKLVLLAFLILGCWFGLNSLHTRTVKVPAIRQQPNIPRLRPTLPLWANLFAIDIRYLLDAPVFPKRLGLLIQFPLPIWLYQFCQNAGLRHSAIQVILVMLLVPLLFSMAGFVFEFRWMHASMMQLYASMGIRNSLVRITDIAVVEVLFLLSSLPLIYVLHLMTGTYRSIWIIPLGLLGVAVFAWINYRSERYQFIFKLAVASILCTGAIRLVVA